MKPLENGDPQHLGQFEITERIGAGGMGVVFLGRSPSGRRAAVKVVRSELADDQEFRDRFRREIDAARQVSGAYTAAVLDADPDAPRPWLATAFIDGPSLLARVRGAGPLRTREVRVLGAGLAEAMAELHRVGLVHRDIKPGNVLLAPDGPRLIDFGIIRSDALSELTESGAVLGSVGFMAPEQAEGEAVGPAADVFAAGAVLTFAALGRGPFGTGSAATLLLRTVKEEPDVAALPEQLRTVITRCLAKDPAARPTVPELLDLLVAHRDEPEPEPDLGPKPVVPAAPKTPFAPRPALEIDEDGNDVPAAAVAAPPPPKAIPGKPKPLAKPSMPGKSGKPATAATTAAAGGKPALAAKPATSVTPAPASSPAAVSLVRPAPAPLSHKAGVPSAAPPAGQLVPSMNPRRRAVIGATAVAGLAVVGLLAEMISHDATHPASSPPDKPYTPPSPFAMPTNSPAKQPLWQTSNGSSSDAKISALDGVLYVATNGGLKAVNATGATTWTTSSSEFGSAETNGLSAPVAVGKQLFSLDGAALIGISADHNNIASTVRLPPTAGQDPNPVTDIIGVVGSAIVCRVIGHSSATGGTDGLLSTVDTKTSAVLWSVPSTGVPEATTAQGDLLVVADTGIITAYHALTGKPVWQTPNQNEQGYQGADIPRGLLAAATTRLYQATAASIRSLDAATGRLGWTSAPPLAGGSYSSLIAEEGFVYGITLTPDELKQSVTTGTVFALREADGSVAWSVSDIPCDNTPSNFILSDGVLYTKDRNSTMLMALDAASGTTLWHWQEQYPLYEDLWGTGLAADSERVYATLQEGIAAFSIR